MKNTINFIEDTFKSKLSKPIGNYRNSAVMILIQIIEGEPNIIFEVRSNKLTHQPGDVCLPGGMMEVGETPKNAAIRETMEELNLTFDDIEYIGEMDYFISPYGMFMYPFISKTNKMDIVPSEDEVDHIFSVPLKFFLENEPLLYNMEIGPTNQEGFPFHLVSGGKNYKFRKGMLKEYFYQYNQYIIWGFTAQIIKSFVEILQNS